MLKCHSYHSNPPHFDIFLCLGTLHKWMVMNDPDNRILSPKSSHWSLGKLLATNGATCSYWYKPDMMTMMMINSHLHTNFIYLCTVIHRFFTYYKSSTFGFSITELLFHISCRSGKVFEWYQGLTSHSTHYRSFQVFERDPSDKPDDHMNCIEKLKCITVQTTKEKR